jgi:hypothetical protein
MPSHIPAVHGARARLIDEGDRVIGLLPLSLHPQIRSLSADHHRQSLPDRRDLFQETLSAHESIAVSPAPTFCERTG